MKTMPFKNSIGSILFVLAGAVSTVTYAQSSGERGDMPPGGPGGGPGAMTEEQRSCLEKNGAGRPEAGQRPDMEKMKAAMTKCGLEAPKARPKESNDSVTTSKKTTKLPEPAKSSATLDVANYFKIYKNQGSKYVRVAGLIPNACADKLALDYECDADKNTVQYFLQDRDGSGLSCLQDKKDLCAADSEKCVSLESLEAESKSGFNAKLNQSKSADKSCKQIDLKDVKVVVSASKQLKKITRNKSIREDDSTDSEAGFCADCEKAQARNKVNRLKKEADDISDKLDADLDSDLDGTSNRNQMATRGSIGQAMPMMMGQQSSMMGQQQPMMNMSGMGGMSMNSMNAMSGMVGLLGNYMGQQAQMKQAMSLGMPIGYGYGSTGMYGNSMYGNSMYGSTGMYGMGGMNASLYGNLGMSGMGSMMNPYMSMSGYGMGGYGMNNYGMNSFGMGSYGLGSGYGYNYGSGLGLTNLSTGVTNLGSLYGYRMY